VRVLITGGAGFIGSHLTDALLEREHEVVALDDLSTGRLANLEHLTAHPRFRCVHGSVLDASAVSALVETCDEVYHLAAAVGVKFILAHPLQTLETNVRGTEVVLEAASRAGRKTFLASTSEVYGTGAAQGTQRFRETDPICLGLSPRWCYATSKALDEALARAYAHETRMPVVIGRLFNTVGPRQRGAYGMVLPRFVQQALAGDAITVYGDGTHVRSFTWVHDVVRAMMALMAHPDAAGDVYNIGSEQAVTIEALAERVRALADSRSEITHIAYAEAYGPEFEEPRYRVPDITKLSERTGYRPTRGLDDIIRDVIAYFRGAGTREDAR